MLPRCVRVSFRVGLVSSTNRCSAVVAVADRTATDAAVPCPNAYKRTARFLRPSVFVGVCAS